MEFFDTGTSQTWASSKALSQAQGDWPLESQVKAWLTLKGMAPQGKPLGGEWVAVNNDLPSLGGEDYVLVGEPMTPSGGQ